MFIIRLATLQGHINGLGCTLDVNPQEEWEKLVEEKTLEGINITNLFPVFGT
jgi:hypothetical protein